MSFFSTLSPLPSDPIFGLTTLFQQDPHPKKVNLSIGVYTNEVGKTVVFDAITQVQNQLHQENLKLDYQPIEGNALLIDETLKLVMGDNLCNLPRERFFGAQAIGGTGALRIGAEFLSQTSEKNVYVSDPTWPIHHLVFQHAGMNVHTYPYYNSAEHKLSFGEMKDSIKRMSPGSVIVLHACCHNPTGVDPSEEEWKELSTLILQQKVFPFFDLAYQGFGKGIIEDVFPIHQFIRDGHELFIACSFSKNFGLYGERGGCFLALTKDPSISKTLGTHIKPVIRGLYSNPPLTAGRLVSRVLSNPTLRKSWLEELAKMRQRIESTRTTFIELLSQRVPRSDFSYLSHQNGMFSIMGITKPLVERLRKEYGIYLPDNGRISIPGLNPQNIEYAADSIAKVFKG